MLVLAQNQDLAFNKRTGNQMTEAPTFDPLGLIDKSPNSWLCEIDQDYLMSQVSYYGLNQYVTYYSHSASIIKGNPFDPTGVNPSKLKKLAESCRLLYGLLHGRFILTETGTYLMNIKYSKGIFGHCPRFSCKQQKLLPIGLTSVPFQEKAKCY